MNWLGLAKAAAGSRGRKEKAQVPYQDMSLAQVTRSNPVPMAQQSNQPAPVSQQPTSPSPLFRLSDDGSPVLKTYTDYLMEMGNG